MIQGTSFNMPEIRHIHIEHYRVIDTFDWFPSSGINCLIGPGDTGKSTILDAIDKCLTAHRYIYFSDADFHNLDTQKPIIIEITIGALTQEFLHFDKYGEFLKGFDATKKQIVDEPDDHLEPVLTIQLFVDSDLEAKWSFVSNRSERKIGWAERSRLSPLNLSSSNQLHFKLQQGSILNDLHEGTIETRPVFVDLTRQLGENFDKNCELDIDDMLDVVADSARSVGVEIGEKVMIGLDPNVVSLKDSNLCLKDSRNIPLQNLGTGSKRLLIAALLKRCSGPHQILLVDEVEQGLEPHRLVQFLEELGSKTATTQVFITTHSPVPIMELDWDRLFILQKKGEKHHINGIQASLQGIARRYPQAFLAKNVICCEGASEYGLLRGVNSYYFETNSRLSIHSRGTVFIDCRGGTNFIDYAGVFNKLGYKTSIFRDNDVINKLRENKKLQKEQGLQHEGVEVLTYSSEYCLESAISETVIEEDWNTIIEYGKQEIPGFESALRSLIDKESLSLYHKKEARVKVLELFKRTPTISHFEFLGRKILGPALAQERSGELMDILSTIFNQ